MITTFDTVHLTENQPSRTNKWFDPPKLLERLEGHISNSKTLSKNKIYQAAKAAVSAPQRELSKLDRRESILMLPIRTSNKETARKIRQRLKNKLFIGEVIIAANEVNFGFGESRHVYWTDASHLRNSCYGIGAVYATAETWIERARSFRGKVIPGSVNFYALEIYATANAL
ncbi:hypothetical protein N431DRAFT_454023 [Stipitochalara longipes BDJ]|nr:hypothetical protein N431DRAFT_454023 [Stipitochalara longipes BDJ]